MKKAQTSVDVTTGWINLNTSCNNRCLWCYRKEGLNKKAETMSFKTALKAIDFLSELNVHSCIFIGGEPTLYKGLSVLVKRAKDNGIEEVTVVTNGRLLNNIELVKDLKKSGLDVFSISIHSAKEKVHNAISRRESWEDTMRGIKNVIANNGKCSINLVVGNQNLYEVTNDIPVFLEWGIDQIIVSCAIPHISGTEIDGSFALDPKKFANLVEKISHQSDKVVILHELPLCLISRETFLRLARNNRLGYGCHIGVGRGLSIDVDGNAIPCNSFPHHPILKLFEKEKTLFSVADFLKVWRADKTIKELRKEANVFRSAICKKCDLWEMCNCGCPLTWGYFEPEKYINNGLLGIKAKTVYAWTKKRYNP